MLYKRSKKQGAVWWTRFTIRKREVRVSTGTNSKTDAEDFERRLRSEVWREVEFGEIHYTWDDAKARWLEEKSAKRTLKRDKEIFKSVAGILDGMFLADIDEGVIDKLFNKFKGRAPSGINRDIACIKSVLNRAREKWKWITSFPLIEMLEVVDTPPRWERPERVQTLIKELPPHAKAIAEFAVAAGPRSGNIFGLRWDRVDLENRYYYVESSEHKGKRTVGFPLNQAAVDILKKQVGKHPVYCFPDHRGRAPLKSIKGCWKKACSRAGLVGFRVHDLRHSWTAWHKLKGTPDRAIKELGGWASMQMLERYGHINPTDFAQYADNLPTKSGTRRKKK